MEERLILCKLEKLIVNKENYPCNYNFACELNSSCPDLQLKKAKDKAGTIKLPKINKSPQNRITSKILIEKITPYCEQIRKEIFGNTKAPFKDNIKKSIAWIEKKAEEPMSASVKKYIKRRMKHGYGFTHSTLDYPGDGEYLKVVYAYQPDLNKLSEAASSISDGTGFEKYAITIFILTGLEPVIRRFQVCWNSTWVNLPTGEPLHNFNINIKINAKDLSFNELKNIYDGIRDQLNLKKKKPSTEKHYKLFHRVKQLGIPEKNKRVFWEKIAKEFQYSDYDKAYTAYRRILVKNKKENSPFK